MTPAPLSKERREQIQFDYAQIFANTTKQEAYTLAIAELLADAAYWREAVKNFKYAVWSDATDFYTCDFCERGADGLEGLEHKADCSWLLAQESE